MEVRKEQSFRSLLTLSEIIVEFGTFMTLPDLREPTKHRFLALRMWASEDLKVDLNFPWLPLDSCFIQSCEQPTRHSIPAKHATLPTLKNLRNTWEVLAPKTAVPHGPGWRSRGFKACHALGVVHATAVGLG